MLGKVRAEFTFELPPRRRPSAFVDGELKEIDAKNVMDHLNRCPTCRGFVDLIRQYAHFHRDAFDEDAILESFDGEEAFQGIASELLREKILKVAEFEIFFEGEPGEDQANANEK